MRESVVWAWAQRTCPPHIHIERLEVKFPPGLADTVWTLRRAAEPVRSGFLELKYCASGDPELRAGRIPKLRPAQPIFLNRWARHGMHCGIFLRVSSEMWKVWRATGRPEWIRTVGGTVATSYADRTWLGDAPTLEEVVDVLLTG